MICVGKTKYKNQKFEGGYHISLMMCSLHLLVSRKIWSKIFVPEARKFPCFVKGFYVPVFNVWVEDFSLS